MKRIGSLLRSLRARDRSSTPSVARLSAGQLFEAATEGTLIVEAATSRIVEANPAAAEVLGIPYATLAGAVLATVFGESAAIAIAALEADSRASGRSPVVPMTTRDGFRQIGVSMSLARAAKDSFLLVHLAPVEVSGDARARPRAASAMLDLIEEASDGFLVTNLGLKIQYANRAFAELVGVKGPNDLRGKSLTGWVEFSQDTLTCLRTQMLEFEAVTVLQGTLTRGENRGRSAQLNAVAVPDKENQCFGFWVRDSSPAVAPVGGSEGGV